MNSAKKKTTAYIVSAFVDGNDGGNPAGIVLDADSLTRNEKQFIASKIGLSETAFVSQSKVADIKLDFFTPIRQIPHCGHATIATFTFLVQQGRITNSHSSKETIDGRREIFIRDDLAYMEQLAPKYTQLSATKVTPNDILSSLHLSSDKLISGQLPVIVNTGVNCLLVPLNDELTVKGIIPDLKAVEDISRELDLIEYYIFSTDTKNPLHSAGARMFAPLYGIPEESATGMAAGPLACFLYDYMNIKKNIIKIEQGYLMNPPSPSELIVELKLAENEIKSLLVGGRGMVTKTLEVEY